MRERVRGTLGPLIPDDGPRGARVLRRTRGIALELIVFVLLTALSPVLVLGAAAIDLTLWIRRRKRVFRLKRRWLGSHLAGLRGLFGLRFETEGLELAGPGPVLVLIRHASIIDNALPDVIIGGAHRIGFRFVI